MTTSLQTAISWGDVLQTSPPDKRSLLIIRDAILHSYNDSFLRFRQSLREITLLFFLGEDVRDLIQHMEIHGFYWDDPRAGLYRKIVHTMLGVPQKIEVCDELLTHPSLESLEYAFLLLVCGSLQQDMILLEKGASFLQANIQSGIPFSNSIGINLLEFEDITPEGILSLISGKDADGYCGRLENITMLRFLRQKIQSIPNVSPAPLSGIQVEHIGGGISVESMGGENTSFYSYIKEGIGVVAMGPSFFPLCEGETFGVFGNDAKNGCASLRKKFSNGQIDIGWLYWTVKEKEKGIRFSLKTIASEEMYPFALCLLLKGDEVHVEGGKKLLRRSLDKYQDEAKGVVCKGGGKNFTIASEHKGEMQLIPLAGNCYFFGADFLLAYIIEGGREKITLEMV